MRTQYPAGTKVNGGITLNKKEQEALSKFMTLASVNLTRSSLARGLGKMYGGQRDVYATLGYKKDLEFDDYNRKFVRQDIAKRIITAYPDATWRGQPSVIETEDPNQTTAFEKSWDELTDTINVWSYFTRVDKLAGIGKYAVLFLGFDDVSAPEELANEVQAGTSRRLLYMQPYSEKNAEVNTWDADHTSERYGLPMTYKLRSVNFNVAGTKTDDIRQTASFDLTVHWSRIVHVAEGLLESNVMGVPRLECVYNRLENLELIAGGSAEMFWRGASKDLALEMEPGTQIDDEDALNDEIDEYVHNLRRVLKLKGIKAKNLAPGAEDPEKHVDVQLKLISGATGIPVRILTGSERGELASTQDKENWTDRVAERRNDFAEPVIMAQFIDRCVAAGVLKAPGEEGYTVVWPDIDALSDKDQAEIGKLRSEALKAYVASGAEVVVPPMHFLTRFLGFTEEEAEAMMEEVMEMLEQERQDAEALAAAEAAAQEEEAAQLAEEEETAEAEEAEVA